MKTLFFILAGVSCLLVSCSSPRSYTLAPKQNQNIIWRNGESGISDTTANMYCMVTSPEVKNEKVSFNMRFHNDGNEILLIDPATFYTKQTSKDGTISHAVAYTPQQLLDQYNRELAAKRTGNTLLFAAVVAVIVGAAVVAASSSKSKTSEQHPYSPPTSSNREGQDRLDRIERRQREQEREKSHNYTPETSSPEISSPPPEEVEMDTLQHNMLRKHSLFPDESISGLVVFPLLYNTKELEVNVPIKDSCSMKFSYDIIEK